MPSAGILSPVCSMTMSFTTISSINTSFVMLFLLTFVFILDDFSWSLSKAFSLPYSEIVDMRLASMIAIKMPIVSYQSKFLNNTIVLNAKAIIKIFIMGSPRVSSKSFRKLSFFLIYSSLFPYFFLFH